MRFGICASPGFVPTSEQLSELKPVFIRSILYNIGDLDVLMSTGYPLFITANNQMEEIGSDWSGWDDAITLIAERAAGRLIGVGCANELDIYHQDNPADVPPSFAADLVHRAARILRPRGIKTVATSVAGRDWQTYLQQMADLCRDDADWFDLHPYGQRPDGWDQPGWGHGDLRVALSRACEIAQKPVICSEEGVKIGDAGGEQQVASFLTAAASTVGALGPSVCPEVSWFAWTDAVGAPSERGPAAFGLVAEDGRLRPAWQAFADLSPAAVPVPPVESPMPTTREEVIAISNRVADEYGIPRLLLLGCGIAESNLAWDARRPLSADQDASSWPDVSGGVWQQTVRYDPEYAGGNAYPGSDETERILRLQYDVDRSARVAAEQLKRHLTRAMVA